MRIRFTLLLAVIGCISANSNPITYSTVSCKLNDQVVRAANSCSLSTTFEGIRVAEATASSMDGALLVRALGNFLPGGLFYTAGASATFDSYEEILWLGPVRPGLAVLSSQALLSQRDTSGSVFIQFGDYTWLITPIGGNPVPVQPIPITLGVPLWIHLHADLTGFGDPLGFNTPNSSAQVALQYRLFEADALTPAAFVSVEIPEPSLTMAVLAALLILAALRSQCREPKWSRRPGPCATLLSRP